MGLIDNSKDTYKGPSRELQDELDRMFSGAANKRQRLNPSTQQLQQPDYEANPGKYLGVVDKKLNEE